jgi:ribose/xylose/arabinose/galactoside ABC-type transport system permease subunit
MENTKTKTTINRWYEKYLQNIGKNISKGGTTFSLVLVYIIICIIFFFLSPFFLTAYNFTNIGIFCSIVGVMAAGSTVAMLVGALDLSQYAIYAMTGILAATLIQAGMNFVVASLISILVGVVGGIINGALVSAIGIPAIIVTLGTMQIFRGFAYLLTGGQTIMIANKPFRIIGTGYIFNFIPIPILIMVIIFIITFYILKYTGFGRKIFAVGGNEKASYLSGINVKFVKFGAMIFSGVCASLAGIISASQVGAAIPSSGVGSEMSVLTAVILGGVSLSGGKGKISGTIMGVLILATIQNGLTLLSVPSFYVMLINGAVLVLAVSLDIYRTKLSSRKKIA